MLLSILILLIIYHACFEVTLSLTSYHNQLRKYQNANCINKIMEYFGTMPLLGLRAVKESNDKVVLP